MEERIPVAIAVMMMMMMMSGTVCEERRQTWPDLFTPVHRVSRYIYLLICRENPFVSLKPVASLSQRPDLLPNFGHFPEIS